jgi:hypothetical protein
MNSKSTIEKRLNKIKHSIDEVVNGLNGKPFNWGDGERIHHQKKLKKCDITLLTITALKKRGYRLKRGAKPVGSAYFGRPIKNIGQLYVLECQAIKETTKETTCQT